MTARLKGQTIAEVARLFEVSDTTVEKYWRLRRRGASLAVGRSPGKTPRLAPHEETALVTLVQENTNWTLEQLSREWHKRSGVLLPRSTIHDHLRRFRSQLQKKSRIAQERCEVKRARFREQIASVAPEKPVFLDECGVSLNMYRLYGWGVGGERLEKASIARF